MIRIFAILFGIAFIFVGVIGFLPTYKTDDLLFGYLNVAFTNNCVHLLTGVIAIMAATGKRLSELFFKIFGLVYVATAIWGFWSGGDLYIMHVNFADNLWHLAAGLLAILIGFKFGKKD
jgi:hypothetical protein